MVKRKVESDDTVTKPVDINKVSKKNNKGVKVSASAVDVATLGEEKEKDAVVPIKEVTPTEITIAKAEKKMTEKQLQKIKATQKKQ